jgi:hypothetical protein
MTMMERQWDWSSAYAQFHRGLFCRRAPWLRRVEPDIVWRICEVRELKLQLRSMGICFFGGAHVSGNHCLIDH